MMQQIAPLQTDIAAKSTSDTSSGIDKQWLGSENQQQQQYGNGAEFGRALEQQKRASLEPNVAGQRSEKPASKPTTEQSSDQPTESSESTTDAANRSTNSQEEATESTVAIDAKEAQKPVSETEQGNYAEELSTSEKSTVGVSLSQDVENKDIAEQPIINWVALVEEVKSLNEITAEQVDTGHLNAVTSHLSLDASIENDFPNQDNIDKAVKSLDLDSVEMTPVPVDEITPIWDGEIAEMLAIDDSPLIIKKADMKPIYTIELPPVQADALVSGEAEQVVKVAETLLTKLQSSPLIQGSDGDPSKSIPNDLYVKPIEELKLDSRLVNTEAKAALEADVTGIGQKSDSMNETQILEEDTQLESTGLLSVLVSDLVTKSNDSSTKSSDDADVKSTASVSVDTTAELVDDAVKTADVDQAIATSGVQRGSAEVIVQKPVIVIDASDVNALKSISKLDMEQQKLVLDDVASRINKVSTEPMNSNQQQTFVAALQAGVEEFSKQLQQGREPGMSIKALIAEAMGKAEISPENVPTQQLSQITAQLTQTLNLTDALRNSLNDAAINTQQVSRAELGSLEVSNQTEASKQSQLSQVLDKPANILRPDGQNQFAEKIRWMVNARNSFAEIRLDPPDLGSVQVKVSTAGETATVSFVVQSQQARDALDQATPRLREMLAQQGIELGQSSVQQESQQQQEQQQDGQFAQHKGDDGMEDVASEVIEQRATGGVAGGIDFYA